MMSHNLYNSYMLNESRIIIKSTTSDNDTSYHIVVPLEQYFRSAEMFSGTKCVLLFPFASFFLFRSAINSKRISTMMVPGQFLTKQRYAR